MQGSSTRFKVQKLEHVHFASTLCSISYPEMRGLKLSLCLVALLELVDAIAIPPHHEVHEKRGALHPRWTKQDRVESYKLLPMRIGLTQTNLENGYEHLMDVYVLILERRKLSVDDRIQL